MESVKVSCFASSAMVVAVAGRLVAEGGGGGCRLDGGRDGWWLDM